MIPNIKKIRNCSCYSEMSFSFYKEFLILFLCPIAYPQTFINFTVPLPYRFFE